MTEQEELEAVKDWIYEIAHPTGDEMVYDDAVVQDPLDVAAFKILALRKQLAAKDELIQSQRGLIEKVCKREAAAQQRVAELEEQAEGWRKALAALAAGQNKAIDQRNALEAKNKELEDEIRSVSDELDDMRQAEDYANSDSAMISLLEAQERIAVLEAEVERWFSKAGAERDRAKEFEAENAELRKEDPETYNPVNVRRRLENERLRVAFMQSEVRQMGAEDLIGYLCAALKGEGDE